MRNYIFYIFILATLLSSCQSLYRDGYAKPDLVDNKVSRPARKLHQKLHFTAARGFAIGHQDATSYGIGWKWEPGQGELRSDVKEMVNDYPAVYGFDIGGIEHNATHNLDSVPFDLMRQLMVDAHKRGGIVTVSWHADNPVTDDDSWDQTPAIADILSGAEVSKKYDLWLDRLANFLKTVKHRGKPIPLIFRPYHEMNGAWFWWGDPHTTVKDYVTLWKYTVKKLRDEHKLHNLLYTYSPNKLNPDDYYMKFYPGDDWVDIMGIDIYDFNDSTSYVTSVINDLELVKTIATRRKKLYAFTETGFESIPEASWYTNRLYPAISQSGIAWVLFWRNYSTKHHYMPYKGHVAEEDFKNFEALPETLFLKDLKSKNK